jgi:hypothetical protein
MKIYEAEGKTAVIAFGRMNPPTIGHAKLADKIASLPGDPYIFLSHSQKPKTDPLSFEQKAGYAKAFFPNVTVGDPEVRTAIQAFSKISDMGYSNLIYVAGSDRVDDFQKLLSTYNGQPDKEGNVAYNFDNIKVVSAGARDPDAEGAEGMSASKMRAAAASGDFESFKSGTPDPKLAQAMYRDVRNGLGMMESLARIIEVATMLKSLDEVKPITEDVKKVFGVVVEVWSEKYKRSIDCNNPKGFSQRAHCQGRKKNEDVAEGSYTTEKQILTRIRQIMYDRKLSGTESNAGELLRLKQQLKDLRSQQGMAEGTNEMAGESQLNERATDIVYHYTTIGPALNILKSGEFQLSSVAGSVEQNINPKGHNFFLSTARSKGGEYHSKVGDSAVMFVLNGRWISDRYPVKPVDYWAGFSIAGRTKEAEDRIFSKDPTMPIDPVTSIHVLLKEQNPFASAKTRQFLIRAKTLGIPTYLYKDESAWRLQNTAKAASVEQMKSELSGPEKLGYIRSRGSGSRWLKPWLEVIFGKTDADLGKKAKDLVRGFRYYHNDGDDHGLGNELSNARKPGNLDREDAVKILKFMRQNRMLTHKDLVNYLVDKWKVKDESINEAGVGRITKQNATKDAPIGSEYANVKKLGFGSGKPKELHAKARKNSDPNTLFNLGLTEGQLNEKGSIGIPLSSGMTVVIAPHRPLKVRKSKKKVKMVGAGGEE